MNKVCGKREKSSSKVKNCNEINDSYKSSLKILRHDLLEILRNEFRDSIESKNFTFNINFNKSLEKVLVQTSTIWNSIPHFISSESFDLNKSTSYCSDRDQTQTQTHYFANSSLKKINRTEVNIFDNYNHQQVRTFKTYRSVVAENQRNPTILSRLKEAYNQPSVGGLKRLETSNQATQQTTQSLQHESLSKLLNQYDSNLTTEQKQQLKVAFAEGYLAASHPDNAEKGGKAIKYLKVMKLNFIKLKLIYFKYFLLIF